MGGVREHIWGGGGLEEKHVGIQSGKCTLKADASLTTQIQNW